MARVSNGLLGALNAVTLLLSISVVAAGVYFRMNAGSECERALRLPVLVLGCALLLLSLAGLAGACSPRASAPLFLWFYVLAMFLLIVAVFAFTVFAFVVTKRQGAGAGGTSYSGWLRARIAEPETWRRVESCLAEARVCGRFDGVVGLPPIQSGCCKPPARCVFRYVNATFWEPAMAPAPTGGDGDGDGDCWAWSNDQRVLCFGCDACKAGVLATVKKQWKAVAVFNVVLLALLVVIYTLGCCAMRSGGGSSCDGWHYHGGGA